MILCWKFILQSIKFFARNYFICKILSLCINGKVHRFDKRFQLLADNPKVMQISIKTHLSTIKSNFKSPNISIVNFQFTQLRFMRRINPKTFQRLFDYFVMSPLLSRPDWIILIAASYFLPMLLQKNMLPSSEHNIFYF